MNLPSLQKIKSNIIDLVADVAPWLAPTAPAYMVLVNMRDKLGFPEAVAWMVALAVETLGLASVHTALEFWQWNGEKRKTDDAAPFVVALSAIMFYIVVILTINAVLDATLELWALILSKALLSLLSLDAALIVALRAGQARRKAELEDEKAERKAERAAERLARSQDAGNIPERAANPPQDAGNMPEGFGHLAALRGTFPTDWRKISADHKRQLDALSAAEIAFVTGLSDRAGREWRARLTANGFHEEK